MTTAEHVPWVMREKHLCETMWSVLPWKPGEAKIHVSINLLDPCGCLYLWVTFTCVWACMNEVIEAGMTPLCAVSMWLSARP